MLTFEDVPIAVFRKNLAETLDRVRSTKLLLKIKSHSRAQVAVVPLEVAELAQRILAHIPSDRLSEVMAKAGVNDLLDSVAAALSGDRGAQNRIAAAEPERIEDQYPMDLERPSFYKHLI